MCGLSRSGGILDSYATIFDMFALNGGLVDLKLPKRINRGVDMIWDRMFGANALDLSLHKPRSELNAEEKQARKTAKKNESKDGGNRIGWPLFQSCEGNTCMQASAFQSGLILSEWQGEGHAW